MPSETDRLITMIDNLQAHLDARTGTEREAVEERLGPDATETELVMEARYGAWLDARTAAQLALERVRALIADPTLEVP